MGNIGVMIVDDEVLAIEYLRGMVPWEEYGFTVVAEATDGKKALECLKKYGPQVAFVDIRMPVMDGLEFCKRAAAMNAPVKIIFLTAYKDFEYARQAIEFGVTNYILKHDVSGPVILNELKKAREELEKEEKRKSILRRKCFRDLIHGVNTEELAKDAFPAYIRNENHILLLCQVDLPYPVVEEYEPPFDFFPAADIGIKCAELPQFILGAEVIDLDERRFAVVVSVKKTNSQLETIHKMYEMSRNLQHTLRDKSDTTVSVAVSRIITDPANLRAEYHRLQKSLDLRIFFGREKIFMFDSFPSRRDLDEESLALGLGIVDKGLYNKKTEEIASGLDILFTAVHLSPEGLKKICRELRVKYDEFCRKNGLELHENRLKRGAPDSSLWFDASGLKGWFFKEFTASMERADDLKNNTYSRKTQQAVSYIQKHYSEELSIEQVAREIDISCVYLMKLFQKEVGQTFVEYLTSYRVDIAKKLLAEGRSKVYEISEMVGYRSSQYFSQVFRKLTGMNPLDYKGGGETDEKQH